MAQRKSKSPPNPTGKGGFADHPEHINRDGAPKRANSWSTRLKEIMSMTREEAIEFVGKKTRMGRLLKELPPEIPIKDALIFSSIIAYGREPNARMLTALMDREDGKVAQPVDLNAVGELKVIIEYADSNNHPAKTTPSADTNQE